MGKFEIEIGSESRQGKGHSHDYGTGGFQKAKHFSSSSVSIGKMALI
jgi:hypothetical protein